MASAQRAHYTSGSYEYPESVRVQWRAVSADAGQKLSASAIQIEPVDAGDVKISEDFRALVYEFLMLRVGESGAFKQVFRSGDRAAVGVPDLVTLHTQWKCSSRAARRSARSPWSWEPASGDRSAARAGRQWRGCAQAGPCGWYEVSRDGWGHWSRGGAGGARLLEHALYGVKSFDPVSLIAVCGLLAGIAFVACWIPARRAAATSPIIALRP